MSNTGIHVHTYATLGISQAAFDEIQTKMAAAGCSDQFILIEGKLVALDMYGIAIEVEGQG